MLERYAIPGFNRYALVLEDNGTWTVIGARGRPLGGTYPFGDTRRQYFTLRNDTGDYGHVLQLGRIVLLATLGPPPTGTECCHKDGDASNNNPGNLYWGTKEQNQEDARRHARERVRQHHAA